MGPRRVGETLELVNALVAGSYEGNHYSTKDEAQMPAPKGSTKQPENMPEVEYADREKIARKALEAVEPFLGGWMASMLAEPGEGALAILRDIGVTPEDLCSPEALEDDAERLCERPLEYVPAFYEPELIRAAAEVIAGRMFGGF